MTSIPILLEISHAYFIAFFTLWAVVFKLDELSFRHALKKYLNAK